MTENMKILIILLVLAFGEGRPLTKDHRPYQGNEESWDCDDDDDCLETKAPLTTEHLTAAYVQEEFTSISRRLEQVLHSYPGLEFETSYSEKYNEIVVNAKISLRADKAPLTAKHLSAAYVQEEFTGISRRLVELLHNYPGLEFETSFSEKYNEIVVNAKISLRTDNDIYNFSENDSDDDDFIIMSDDDEDYELWDDDNDGDNDSDNVDDNDDGNDDDNNSDDDDDDEIYDDEIYDDEIYDDVSYDDNDFTDVVDDDDDSRLIDIIL